jgi:hypothetical protein
LGVAGDLLEREEDRKTGTSAELRGQPCALIEAARSSPPIRCGHRHEKHTARQVRKRAIGQQRGERIARIATATLVEQDRTPEHAGVPARGGDDEAAEPQSSRSSLLRTAPRAENATDPAATDAPRRKDDIE